MKMEQKRSIQSLQQQMPLNTILIFRRMTGALHRISLQIQVQQNSFFPDREQCSMQEAGI